MKRVFLLVGGSQRNYRAKQLANKFNEYGGGYFIVSGCPNGEKGELISMLTFLKKWGYQRNLSIFLGHAIP